MKKKISVKFSPVSKNGGGSLSFSSRDSDTSHHVNDPPSPDVSVEAPKAVYPVMAFRIHDRWFALKQHLVHQIASFAMPRPLPGKTNDVFLGLVYAAGASYLCFSFHGLLRMEMPDESSLRRNSRPRLIIIGTEKDRWAFIAEELIMTTISVSQNQEETTGITTAWDGFIVLRSFDLHGEKAGLLEEETLFTVLNRSLVV